MLKRRRFKLTMSLKDRHAQLAEDARGQAARMPPGLKRDDLLRRARQADTASHIEDWVNSPGLQGPT